MEIRKLNNNNKKEKAIYDSVVNVRNQFLEKKPKLKPNGIKLKNLLNLSLNALSKGDAGTFI